MKKKRTAAFLAALMVCTCAPQTIAGASNLITAEAHSGRTDANGGHRDRKNASGLGSYHYHCGGHPAHLHERGICPYSQSAETAHFSESAVAVNEEPDIPEHISFVFDAQYYSDNNPDLNAAYGYDEDQLLNHFLTDGMKEGRAACGAFDVNAYKENNPDLREIYGDDLPSYYNHYMNCGWAEERICH